MGSLIIALLTIGSAAIVSVTSTEIFKEYQSASNWDSFRATAHLWPAVLCSLVAVAAVAMREVGVVNSAKKKERDLEKQLSTMPPKQFLAAYSEIVIKTRFLYETQVLAKSLTSDSVSADIRLVMLNVLMLARNWDSALNDTYRANIMLIEDDKARCTSHLSDLICESPFFLFGTNLDSRIDTADGILYLKDRELSTFTSEAMDAEPDADIETICFPFTLPNTKLETHQPNIPGAPIAISSLQPHYIADCSTHFSEWLDSEFHEDSYISPHYKGVVAKYYSKHRFAGSILAIPLFTKDLDDKKTRVGCFNIYKSKKNILMGDSRNDQFVELLQPICSILSDMICLYRTYSDAEPEDNA
ncbi:hypothetical protein C1Y08_00605 [Pseudomonas sp. FW306-02-F02-AA]|uniref:Uncharacterized protein n=1 Tax=Pseudomonas fluorescens TaxID=294 RepID=A0A0N9WPT9_PSEFL|nr:hypothetical protein AO353_24125 [Pseudomonas fluorescens]PMZ04928.1 hypothetical protein C1Y07_07470 [Pseudomonas sp. FW306-02-F02-AB]PMZ12093.1 hypothetical protein C1Y06_01410 [Pseudomonas sp. FW306-02-H06C]PMZ17853.1 hypothetical protein C1Y08_00605 [Pseudomonas sp. FW306-02-F02-AA]PMZ23885.1 hypothetical protein C1Y09_00605 [Pseudomonas sp. FW306-02-F08-AA]PMZ29725.1 hypothetical protein C1Y05_00605 [Pseudomonas sp. FW306-02-F04-BA]PMZ35283.1 hypothetical protein C1X99_07200 [Pseudomo